MYFIGLAHYVVEGVLVRSGFLLKLALVEPKHWHHEFVDVLEGHVKRV